MKNIIYKNIEFFKVILFFSIGDLKLRYKNTYLGPLWITLSTLIFCFFVGILYKNLFKIEINVLIPHLTLGIVIWSLIVGYLNECTNIFLNNIHYIKNLTISPLFYLLRLIFRHIFILFHNLLVVLIVNIFFKITPSLTALFSVFGLIILLTNLFLVSIFLSIISNKYKDVSQAMQVIFTVIFLITPILWMPKLLPEDHVLLNYNLFIYWIDLIRLPLLNIIPPIKHWVISIISILILTIFAKKFYKINRYEIIKYI